MLFAVTGLLFWIIISIALVLLFVAVATESAWWGLTVIICFFACLYWFGYDRNVRMLWADVMGHPWKYVLYFFLYLVVGVLYSFLKWYFLLLDKRDEIMEIERKNKDIIGHYRDIPNISRYKGRLFRWIFYWPINMLLVIVDRPFRQLFKFIYNKFSHIYSNMAKSVFKDLNTHEKVD